MKFYFIELFHRGSLKTLYKFGVTNSYDILKRFDCTYPERVCYQDFDIKPLFSVKLQESDALKVEEFFLTKYKNNNINDYLGIKKYNYSNLCGITEMRILSKEEKREIIEVLYNIKTKLSNM